VGLLANVLAYQAAKAAGADDAVFVAEDGTVAESTAGNIFIVRAGEIWTPPKGPRILSGVTRDKMLAAARGAGLVCREELFGKAELLAAAEVFLTSTTVQIVPVTQVDGRTVGSGQCGPVTQRVYAEFLRRLPRGEVSRA
jgi:D-alanine transaminase